MSVIPSLPASWVLAVTVGMLFACGTYLILRRGQIKLLLGLGLLSHGVNLLLFGSGRLARGRPPLFLDKESFQQALTTGALERMADPLPQALILTAIVISFGITAFVIMLVHRRLTITKMDVVYGELVPLLRENDPFAPEENLSRAQPMYDWLAYEVDPLYDREDIPPELAEEIGHTQGDTFESMEEEEAP